PKVRQTAAVVTQTRLVPRAGLPVGHRVRSCSVGSIRCTGRITRPTIRALRAPFRRRFHKPNERAIVPALVTPSQLRLEGHAIITPRRLLAASVWSAKRLRHAPKPRTALRVTDAFIALLRFPSHLVTTRLIRRVAFQSHARVVEPALAVVTRRLVRSRALYAPTGADVTRGRPFHVCATAFGVARHTRIRAHVATRRFRTRAMRVSIALHTRVFHTRRPRAAAVGLTQTLDTLTSAAHLASN